MTLTDWLTKTGKTQAEAAELLGISQAQLSRLIARPGETPVRRPSIEAMERILVATNGEVTPNDFVGPEYIDFLPDPPPGAGCELRRAG